MTTLIMSKSTLNKLMQPEIEGYGLVIKADGEPRIDDPESLHPIQKDMLTEEQLERYGVTYTDEEKALVARLRKEQEDAQKRDRNANSDATFSDNES